MRLAVEQHGARSKTNHSHFRCAFYRLILFDDSPERACRVVVREREVLGVGIGVLAAVDSVAVNETLSLFVGIERYFGKTEEVAIDKKRLAVRVSSPCIQTKETNDHRGESNRILTDEKRG